MIKAALCDDNSTFLKEMSVLFEKYCVACSQEIAYEMFCSPLEVLAEIEKGMRWDILFLDVIMPEQNGINVAKEIRQYDTSC